MNSSVNIENPIEKFAFLSDFSALSKAVFTDQSLSLCLIASLYHVSLESIFSHPFIITLQTHHFISSSTAVHGPHFLLQ